MSPGIAWHEGQLFGWVNQLIGLVTALTLITISIAGVLMWLKRRPSGQLGAPQPIIGMRPRWAIAALVVAGLLSPLFGAPLLLLAALYRAIQKRRDSPR